MKTYSQFITEAVAADVSSHPDIEDQSEFKKRSVEEIKRREARRAGTQNAAQNTPPNKPGVRQRVTNAFNRGKQGARDFSQKVGEKSSKVKSAVGDFANKAADTTPRQAAQSVKDAAKNVPNDVVTKLKYGRKIRPNSSTSALATRSSELAKAANTTSKFAKGLRIAGRVAGPAAAALDVASERSKGSGWLRSLAKGAVTAGGAALGGAAGTAVAGPVGTVVGAGAGSMAASKAFDVAAGKNAVERAADRVKNRQRQSGGALVGTGGKTTFDNKKNTMTTGNKTVNLAKTSAVTDPKSGKKETGFLAYKDNKAVYKRADAPGTGSSNAFERIGRSINPNAYKENDAKLAAQKLNKAKANDTARNAALGVKPKK